MDPNSIDPPEGYKDIFVASYWHWGLMRRLYAAAYGLQAFRLRVRNVGPRRIPPDRVAGKRKRKASAPVPKRKVTRKPRPKRKPKLPFVPPTAAE